MQKAHNRAFMGKSRFEQASAPVDISNTVPEIALKISEVGKNVSHSIEESV
jgi:hypothetical protein